MLLLQADAVKPMKHFYPQYPADADPSLAKVGSSIDSSEFGNWKQ
jgi:hypothetical protein